MTEKESKYMVRFLEDVTILGKEFKKGDIRLFNYEEYNEVVNNPFVELLSENKPKEDDSLKVIKAHGYLLLVTNNYESIGLQRNLSIKSDIEDRNKLIVSVDFIMYIKDFKVEDIGI